MSKLSSLEKLMYSIGLIDRVTGPVNKIMGKFDQLRNVAASAQQRMQNGAMGAAGGIMMLVGTLGNAVAANQSLGEVSSLGVANQSLQQLNQTSLSFAADYGGNAAQVISSSYDIQSSISGLTGKELSQFTLASNIMAKGTKADAATATNYLGTMYGIYEKTALSIGKSQWVNRLSGQTATAVRMFKTTGSQMAAGFENLGASAQSHGISMTESLAVLGQLQSTMSGSEAATKYRALLAGVGNAQAKLGVQLTDTHGKLLPMPQLLEKLHGRFGNIDTVAKSDALKKAFGSEEAVALIKLLLPQIDKLKSNIHQLGLQTDMSAAIDMADAQTDAWQRLSGGFNAASTAIGQAILPIIEPFVELLASMLRAVLYLSHEFPILTGVLGTVAVAITAVVVAVGAFNIVMGLYKYAVAGNIVITGAYSVVLAGLKSVLIWTRLQLLAFSAAAAISGSALGALKLITLSATTALWAMAAALLANPITWIVAGVVALVAGIAALAYNWDSLTAGVGKFFNKVGNWFGDLKQRMSAWADSSFIFQVLRIGFDLITLPLQLLIKLCVVVKNALVSAFGAVADAVMPFINMAINAIAGLWQKLVNVGQAIKAVFVGIWTSLKTGFSAMINSVTSMFMPLVNFVTGLIDKFTAFYGRVTSMAKGIADNGLMSFIFGGNEAKTAAPAQSKVTNLTNNQALAKTTKVVAPAQNKVTTLANNQTLAKTTKVVAPAQNKVTTLANNQALAKTTKVVAPTQSKVTTLANNQALTKTTKVVAPAQSKVTTLANNQALTKTTKVVAPTQSKVTTLANNQTLAKTTKTSAQTINRVSKLTQNFHGAITLNQPNVGKTTTTTNTKQVAPVANKVVSLTSHKIAKAAISNKQVVSSPKTAAPMVNNVVSMASHKTANNPIKQIQSVVEGKADQMTAKAATKFDKFVSSNLTKYTTKFNNQFEAKKTALLNKVTTKLSSKAAKLIPGLNLQPHIEKLTSKIDTKVTATKDKLVTQGTQQLLESSAIKNVHKLIKAPSQQIKSKLTTLKEPEEHEKDNEKPLAKLAEVKKLKTTNFFQQFANTSSSSNNNTSTNDNSKRVYIDNFNLATDNPLDAISKMMELAG